ncbi:MAG: PocR ligand-binding domain-containing protein [Desulfotignum sp.]|nr:PocR ligand-binding domain-containing protein [Desulfotignum sp.]
MTLLDICPMETWEALETELYEKFNLQGSVFNPEGIRITQVKNFSNPLCPAIKALEKGQTFICSTAHMNMTAMVKQSRKPVVEECDAGLTKLVVPIFYKDEFVGVAGGCGLLTQGESVDSFAVSKIADMDEAEVKRLESGVPNISREAISQAVDIIQGRIQQILTSCTENC